jgi:hypothetical protein
MRTLQGCIWKRSRLLLVGCSMLLVRCNVWAEPITFARAIDLRKHQIACIGSTVDGVSGCRPEHIAKQLRVPEASDRSNFDCEPLLSGVSEEARCQADLPL